jgi:hypothetical protein
MIDDIFSILVDEFSDAFLKEQMTIVLYYADKKESVIES